MRNLRFILFSLFYVCLLGGGTMAQGEQKSTVTLTTITNNVIEEEMPRLPWTVGTDLLWLIDKNSLPATTIFIKRNVQPKNKIPGAVRMRVGLNFSSLEREIRPDGQPYESMDFDVYTRLGYEWQIARGRHRVLYGADLHLEYNYRYSKAYYSENNQRNEDARVWSWNVGPVGFIGYQYFLSPHISFSTEASYSIIYRRDKRKNDMTYQDVTNYLNEATIFNAWDSRFTPFYMLNLYYHF